MSVFRNLTVAAAVFALSASAYAAQTAPAAKPAAKAPKTTAITASGTVSQYDPASKTLTVTTPKGDVSFTVDSTASITANGKKVMAGDLPSHVGNKVTVRYTEAGGQKMAQSVKVTAAAAKTASAKKTSTAKKS